VKDLDGEVLTALTEDLLLLLLYDLACPVMRIDHLVADLVIDVRRLAGDLELFELLLPSCLFGNGDLLVRADSWALPSFFRFANSGPRD
jgi:hypothetical protein